MNSHIVHLLRRDEELPIQVGLLLVDIKEKEVWYSRSEDCPDGGQLYHLMMAEILGWPEGKFSKSVRVVIPPGPWCYSFSSVYAGTEVLDVESVKGWEQERRGELDRRAARNFKRAAHLMMGVGLPSDWPVLWEISNLKRFSSGSLESWACVI